MSLVLEIFVILSIVLTILVGWIWLCAIIGVWCYKRNKKNGYYNSENYNAKEHNRFNL